MAQITNLNQRTTGYSAAQVQASTLFLAKVFNWMAIGLGLTGIIAFLVANSVGAQQLIFGNRIIFFGLIIGQLALVITLPAAIGKLSARTATGLFLLYSAMTGALLSSVLLI